MDTVVVIYTSMGGLINTMKKELSAALPDCGIINITDDSLVREAVEHGRVTDRMRERMMHYFQAVARWSPKMIISTCSSVREAAEATDKILSVPVIRIDRAMIKRVLQHEDRIGVVASLATTMEPTTSYIRRLASDMERNVRMIGRVARGTYETNSQERSELHDDLIRKEAEVVAGEMDVLILTQGSIAGMGASLKKDTGLSVYASSCLYIKEVQEICEMNR